MENVTVTPYCGKKNGLQLLWGFFFRNGKSRTHARSHTLGVGPWIIHMRDGTIKYQNMVKWVDNYKQLAEKQHQIGRISQLHNMTDNCNCLNKPPVLENKYSEIDRTSRELICDQETEETLFEIISHQQTSNET